MEAVLRKSTCLVPLTQRQIPGSSLRRLPWSLGIVRLLLVQDGPAVQDDGLTLDLGISMGAFLRQIGISNSTGGRKGSATRLRDQITRLAYATITVTETREVSDGVWNHHGENFGFIRGVDLWWSDKDHGGSATLWPNTIRLTQEWRDSIKASAVPLDTRGLALIQAAKAGPMALDLYTWLAHRMFTLRRTTTIPWPLLANQFGGQYDRVRDFKAHLIKALPVVKLAYPGVNVSVADDGLVLRPSPLPVAAKLTQAAEKGAWCLRSKEYLS